MRSAWKRNKVGAAQSKASLAKGSGQVRCRARTARSKVSRSVPLEQLNDQTESLRFAAPGAHAPQINGQLTCYRNDGFLAGRAGSQRAFGEGCSPFYNWFVIGLEPRRLSGQASSTNAARKRGLPCLVTQRCKRVLPLEYSPG